MWKGHGALKLRPAFFRGTDWDTTSTISSLLLTSSMDALLKLRSNPQFLSHGLRNEAQFSGFP